MMDIEVSGGFKEFIAKYKAVSSLEEATTTMSTVEIASLLGLDSSAVDAMMRRNNFVLDNLGGSGRMEWLMGEKS